MLEAAVEPTQKSLNEAGAYAGVARDMAAGATVEVSSTAVMTAVPVEEESRKRRDIGQNEAYWRDKVRLLECERGLEARTGSLKLSRVKNKSVGMRIECRDAATSMMMKMMLAEAMSTRAHGEDASGMLEAVSMTSGIETPELEVGVVAGHDDGGDDDVECEVQQMKRRGIKESGISAICPVKLFSAETQVGWTSVKAECETQSEPPSPLPPSAPVDSPTTKMDLRRERIIAEATGSETAEGAGGLVSTAVAAASSSVEALCGRKTPGGGFEDADYAALLRRRRGVGGSRRVDESTSPLEVSAKVGASTVSASGQKHSGKTVCQIDLREHAAAVATEEGKLRFVERRRRFCSGEPTGSCKCMERRKVKSTAVSTGVSVCGWQEAASSESQCAKATRRVHTKSTVTLERWHCDVSSRWMIGASEVETQTETVRGVTWRMGVDADAQTDMGLRSTEVDDVVEAVVSESVCRGAAEALEAVAHGGRRMEVTGTLASVPLSAEVSRKPGYVAVKATSTMTSVMVGGGDVGVCSEEQGGFEGGERGAEIEVRSKACQVRVEVKRRVHNKAVGSGGMERSLDATRLVDCCVTGVHAQLLAPSPSVEAEPEIEVVRASSALESQPLGGSRRVGRTCVQHSLADVSLRSSDLVVTLTQSTQTLPAGGVV
ncbi:unnamed protein product, partial [Mesocestoides corti]